jgi:hypothetical protein
VSSRRYWLVYTVLRVLMFAIPFGLVVAVSPDFWPLAAVIGAVVSFCGSYIFLRKQREAMAADLAAVAAGRRKPVEDDDSEDAAVDAAERRARATGDDGGEAELTRRTRPPRHRIRLRTRTPRRAPGRT